MAGPNKGRIKFTIGIEAITASIRPDMKMGLRFLILFKGLFKAKC